MARERRSCRPCSISSDIRDLDSGSIRTFPVAGAAHFGTPLPTPRARGVAGREVGTGRSCVPRATWTIGHECGKSRPCPSIHHRFTDVTQAVIRIHTIHAVFTSSVLEPSKVTTKFGTPTVTVTGHAGALGVKRPGKRARGPSPSAPSLASFDSRDSGGGFRLFRAPSLESIVCGGPFGESFRSTLAFAEHFFAHHDFDHERGLVLRASGFANAVGR